MTCIGNEVDLFLAESYSVRIAGRESLRMSSPSVGAHRRRMIRWGLVLLAVVALGGLIGYFLAVGEPEDEL